MGARTRGIANNILANGLDATDGLSGAVSSSNIANSSVTSVSSTPSLGGGFEKVASDPPSPVEGDIWFNTTSNIVKGYVFSATPASWSTGGTTSRGFRGGGGFGGSTGAILFGGSDGEPAPNPNTNVSESYNGTSWTSAPNYPFAHRDSAGTGTSTAGLGICGHSSTGSISTCNEWDGSGWTGTGSHPLPLRANSAFGIQTAAVNAGGGVGAPEAKTAATQEYNGSTWTTVNSMSTAKQNAASSGTQTLGLVAGGSGYPGVPEPTQGNLTEEYDGTSWTNSNNLNNLRNSSVGMTGTQTSSVIYGGSHPTGASNATEQYDGTSWTTLPGVNISNTGASEIQGNGSTTQATAFHVNVPGTEEFTEAVSEVQVKTLTSS